MDIDILLQNPREFMGMLESVIEDNKLDDLKVLCRNKFLDAGQIITKYRLFNVACQYSGIDLIKFLYTPKRINLLDRDGNNPIMCACIGGRSLNIMKFLINKGAILPDEWLHTFNVNIPINSFNYLININSEFVNIYIKPNTSAFRLTLSRILHRRNRSYNQIKQSKILYQIAKRTNNEHFMYIDIVESFMVFNFELTTYLTKVYCQHNNKTILDIYNRPRTFFRLIKNNFEYYGCKFTTHAYGYTKKMLKYLSQYDVNFSIKDSITKRNIFHEICREKLDFCPISSLGMKIFVLLYEVYGVSMNDVDKFGYLPIHYIILSYGKIRLLCYILYKTRHIDSILFKFLNGDRWLQYVKKSCRIYGNDRCGRKLFKQVRKLLFKILRHNILQMLKYIKKKAIKGVKVQGMDAKEIQKFILHETFDINLLYEIYTYLYNISHKEINTLFGKKIRSEYSKVKVRKLK
jgi:ankyrin repeat protein